MDGVQSMIVGVFYRTLGLPGSLCDLISSFEIRLRFEEPCAFAVVLHVERARVRLHLESPPGETA